jgi:hypothetical protein
MNRLLDKEHDDELSLTMGFEQAQKISKVIVYVI